MSPEIAIGGGCALVFALACIALWTRWRRPRRVLPRRTSFHLVVIDPRIALRGRAAFESTPRRFARGSQPGIAIESPVEETVLPAHPLGWDVAAPSVTARLRAAKRA